MLRLTAFSGCDAETTVRASPQVSIVYLSAAGLLLGALADFLVDSIVTGCTGVFVFILQAPDPREVKHAMLLPVADRVDDNRKGLRAVSYCC